MISTQFIIGMLNAPVNQFIQFIISYQFAKISFLRLNEIHELKDEQEGVGNNTLDLSTSKNIFVNNVSFQYSRNASFVLQNVSLLIPEGKVTAIVGDSGSGKSTLLKLNFASLQAIVWRDYDRQYEYQQYRIKTVERKMWSRNARR